MVNKENIQRVIDRIKAEPNKNFKMDNWVCGTSACIGGWCETLAIEDSLKTAKPPNVNHSMFRRQHWEAKGDMSPTEAADFLGISEGAGDALFYPAGLQKLTKDVAIATLERLRDTGKVKWVKP